MKIRLTSAAIAFAAFGLAAIVPASASTVVTVPGYSNPFLTAQSSGGCCGGDSVPGQSPVLAGSVIANTTLTFSATGLVNYEGDTPNDGPNGEPGYLVNDGATNGIGGYAHAPLDSLVGVFIGTYNSGATPATLDFSSPTLTPGLQQTFFIGDGSLGGILVPTGATELYLGTVDGFGWNNNDGAFTVTIDGAISAVPEPATWATLLAGFAMAGFVLRGRRKAFAAA